MDLHDIARQVATTAGADFAFVLSQAGLLVTRDAPRDMPDRGRQKILWACPAGKSDIVHLEMPREDLVPYGGAAPVDVFAVRVEEAAILVAVMASWNDKSQVLLALAAGASSLQEMIRNAKRVRAEKATVKQGDGARRDRTAALPAEPATRRERASVAPPESHRRERTSAVPAEPGRRARPSFAPTESARRERTSVAPAEPRRERTNVALAEPKGRDRKSAVPAEPRRERTSSPSDPGRRDRSSVLPRAQKEPPPKKLTKADPANAARLEALAARVQAAAKRREARARASSEPEIVMGEAPLGRETMVAIEADLPPLAPGPSPESVRVELASIGRETMLEIARFEASEHARTPSVDEPVVLDSRRTLPWVDPATLKRTADAKAAVRGVLPPDVKVTVEEIDPDALERELTGAGKG